jgi:predicted Zn-dependent protease
MPAQALAERALAHPASDDARVTIVDETATAHVRWADGALTTNGSARMRQITLISVVDGAVGAVSRAGAVSDGDVEDVVSAAYFAAREHGARRSGELAGGATGLDWQRPPAEVDAATLGDIASTLHECIERPHRVGRSTCGFAEQQVRTTYLASSTGLRLRHQQPSALVDLAASCAEEGRSAWTGCSAAGLADIDVAAMAGTIDQLLNRPGARAALPPGRYEVLFAPSCAADLMMHLYRAADAQDAIDGLGPFSRPGGGTRLGERLSTVPLTLGSDPAAAGLECAPFTIVRSTTEPGSVFDNGLPLTATRWITDGVLVALAQTAQTARSTGQPRTALIDNLMLHGPAGAPTLPAMIADTDRALLVTSVWYLREIDRQRLLLSGVTRDGVHLIERGEVTAALPDFQFNESPLEILARVTEIGSSEPTLPREWGDCFTRLAMPALRVEGVSVSAP